MHYTPAQVKEALDIKEETLRHWRSKLPPLKGRRGYSPCFSPGDLLALKVVSQFHSMGISISQLTPHAATLFSLLQGAWFGLEGKVLIFDGQSLELLASGQDGNWAQQSRISVPLRPLLRELHQCLSETESPPAQPEIAFPPIGVTQGRFQ